LKRYYIRKTLKKEGDNNLDELSKLKELNDMISKEAELLLYQYGLAEILKKYGQIYITGSYSTHTMTWRDLDIYIDMRLRESEFFNLGREIAVTLKPHRMSYRNNLLENVSNLPRGLYWGIYTNIIETGEWKIDIWAMDSEQFYLYKQESEELKANIDFERRNLILLIKGIVCKNPDYRKTLHSIDIYKAVIEGGVKSIGEFEKWLVDNKGLEYTFIK
jgi:hypothetical protein